MRPVSSPVSELRWNAPGAALARGLSAPSAVLGYPAVSQPAAPSIRGAEPDRFGASQATKQAADGQSALESSPTERFVRSELRKPATGVHFGNHHLPAVPGVHADLEALVKAFCQPSPAKARQALFEIAGDNPPAVLHVEDTQGRGNLTLLKKPGSTNRGHELPTAEGEHVDPGQSVPAKADAGKHVPAKTGPGKSGSAKPGAAEPEVGSLLWLDLNQGGEELLAHASNYFSFSPIKEEEFQDQKIRFEKPSIDHDSIQLTVYSLRHSEDEKSLIEEPIRIYAGHNFVITEHEGPNHSLEERRDSLIRSQTSKSTQDLVASLADQLVLANGHVIESLFADIDELARAVEDSGRVESPEVKERFIRTLNKIGQVERVLFQQRLVLDNFLLQNEDYDSPLISTRRINRTVAKVVNQAQFVREQQIRVGTLEGIQGTEVGNRLNRLMRRGAIGGLGLGIPTMVSGFFGMNVIDQPLTFWGLVAGSVVGSLVIVQQAWKRRWI